MDTDEFFAELVTYQLVCEECGQVIFTCEITRDTACGMMDRAQHDNYSWNGKVLKVWTGCKSCYEKEFDNSIDW